MKVENGFDLLTILSDGGSGRLLFFFVYGLLYYAVSM
jgi:hypothetical protein